MLTKLSFYLADIFCTVFKLGNIKYMPGTIGSLVGVIAGLYFKYFLSIYVYIFFFFIIIIFSIIAINVYQSKKGKSDRSEIIIDEFIGQQIPIILFEINLINILFGFIFFRFFDILKFYPANVIDRKFKGSYGIIGDDIIAGAQASLILYLVNIIL